MSDIIDCGNGDIFNFELSDKNENKYFYEIYSESLQKADRIAQKWFAESYGNKATHLERNVTGYPIARNF